MINYTITPISELPKKATKYLAHHHLEKEYESCILKLAEGLAESGLHLEKIHLDRELSFYSFRLDHANRVYCLLDGDHLQVVDINHHDYRRIEEELRSAHKAMQK